jgi:hypothetical protein
VADGASRYPAALLADRGQQPIDRGAAHRQQRLPHLELEVQVATALEGLHQQRQQRLQSLAAQPIARHPERHQSFHDIRAVPAAVMRFHRLGRCSARLRWRDGIRAVQEPQQRLAVISRELLQLIEELPLLCGAEPPIPPTGGLQSQATTLAIIAGCHGRRRPEASGGSTPRHPISSLDATTLG